MPTQIDLLVFKRNMCIYILTYVGVKKSFSDNRPAFQIFLDGFVAGLTVYGVCRMFFQPYSSEYSWDGQMNSHKQLGRMRSRYQEL